MKRRFFRHDSGAAATELALVAPILLLGLLGSTTYFTAFRVDYRAKRATFTASDMVARQASVDDAYLSNVKSMIENVAQTKGATMGIRITSVVRAEGKSKVAWSYAVAPYAKATEVPALAIPAIADGESVIVVETSLPYAASLPLVGTAKRDIVNVSFARPRTVSQVSKT